MTATDHEILVHVAIFNHVEDNKPQNKSLVWHKFRERLAEHERRDGKDGLLFSPTGYLKNRTRGLAGVATVSMFVLDYDCGIAPEEMTPRWESLEYVLYSTYSHTPEKPKWRAVFLLNESVHPSLWPATYRKLALELGGQHPCPTCAETGQHEGKRCKPCKGTGKLWNTDISCKDASRIYYLPSCPPDGPEPFLIYHPGAPLDPADYPDPEPEEPAAAPAAEPRPTPSSRPAVPVQRDASKRIAARELIDRALDEGHRTGRNNGGLWLATQLRDNGYERAEAEAVGVEYVGRCPAGEDPYTEDEILHSIDQAWTRAPREAWDTPRPFEFSSSGAAGSVAPPKDELKEAIAACLATIDGWKESPDGLSESEFLEQCARLRRWDPIGWLKVKTRATLKRVPMKDWLAAVESLATRDTTEDPEPASGLRRLDEQIDDSPAGHALVPHSYSVRPNGLYQTIFPEGGEYPIRRQIAPAPVILTGRAKDYRTGMELLVVGWKWPDQLEWERAAVDRRSVLSARELSILMSRGLPLYDGKKNEMAEYFAKFEEYNRITLPAARITSSLGWQGDPETAPFLLGNKLINEHGIHTMDTLDAVAPEEWTADRILFHVGSPGEQQVANAFTAAGKLDNWKAAVSILPAYPIALTLFYSGFVTPLLELFGAPNFVVDIAHSTTTGKTSSLRAIASIWGCPDERAQHTLMVPWSASRTWTERASMVAPHLPLCLDDTKNVKQAQVVAETVYQITQGRGRGRGTIQGMQATGHWRNVLYSTGEQPLMSFGEHGGTRARILCFHELPFGDKSAVLDKIIKKFNKELCRHYGHAGPLFIHHLLKNRDRWDEWRELYAKWQEKYANATAEGGRLADYAALITLAGFIAHEALELPWEYTNPCWKLWPTLAAHAADAAGEGRALEELLSVCRANAHRFHERMPKNNAFDDKTPIGEVWGKWGLETDAPLLIHPPIAKKILKDAGFQPDSILTGWRQKGWLDCEKGNFTKLARVGETRARVLAITAEAIDESDREETPA
jgi:hypothetical protein